MHTRVLCVGEMTRVEWTLDKNRTCGCGVQLHDCEFWSPRLSILKSAGYDYRRFTPNVFDSVRTTTSADVIVDLSKTRIWRMLRGWRAPLRIGQAAYILLLRDPRGIMASNIRTNRPLAHRLRQYRKWMRRQERIARSDPERTLIMRYEDLCSDPRTTLRQVCAFIGLDYQEEMLRPADRIHHFINSSKSGYLRGSNELHTDERWRQELNPNQIRLIETALSSLPLLRTRYLEDLRAGSQ